MISEDGLWMQQLH